jgi:hypothetical protein
MNFASKSAICAARLLLTVAGMSLLPVGTVFGDITIRLSVKAVLNPATGNRQPGVSDLVFSNTVAGMKAMLDSNGRGYHLQWNGNALINVGGQNQYSTGPSQYYDVDFVNDEDGDLLKDQFEANAIANPATYGWDASAVNIYIVRFGGANWNVCSFPGSQIILVNGAAGYASPTTVLHEIGHYFNLSHTFNGRQNLNSNGSTCTNGCSCAVFVGGGSDGVADTILDHDCWDSQNDIALGNYGGNYAGLTAARQAAVDRIWFNLMSYHGRQHTTDQLTSDQLDRWTDSANADRPSVRTGRTRFVDRTANPALPVGTSTLPLSTVALGISASSASGSDIVLIRPGNYNEPQTITKAVTMRATRGNAVIGLP